MPRTVGLSGPKVVPLRLSSRHALASSSKIIVQTRSCFSERRGSYRKKAVDFFFIFLNIFDRASIYTDL
jgi:hypothetical protein